MYHIGCPKRSVGVGSPELELQVVVHTNLKNDSIFYKGLEPPEISVSSRIEEPISQGYKGMTI